MKIGTPNRARPMGLSCAAFQEPSRLSTLSTPTRNQALSSQFPASTEGSDDAPLMYQIQSSSEYAHRTKNNGLSEAQQRSTSSRVETTASTRAISPAQEDKDETQANTQTRRPKRMIKTTMSTSAQIAGPSEKDLKIATQRNTAKNMVFHCAIDREIIRVSGPRPPSPTSKIRTTADKDEEEKKAGRGQRAKRRSRYSNEGSEFEEAPPLIERVERARGPGDDEDYATPVRSSKKMKTGHVKTVKWNRELTIIRDDGRPEAPLEPCRQAAPDKSALKLNAQVSMHANVADVRLNLIDMETHSTAGLERRSNGRKSMLLLSSMKEKNRFHLSTAKANLDSKICDLRCHHDVFGLIPIIQLSVRLFIS